MENKAKVILVCGKIGSGKTFYTNWLIENTGAVLLSQDELMLTMFTRDFYHTDPEFYNHEVNMANLYTKNLSVKIAKAGTTVILDNGFWSKEERNDYKEFYNANGVNCEIYYMDTPEDIRVNNIHRRNSEAKAGQREDFIVKEEDIKHYFEIPDESEEAVFVSWDERLKLKTE